MNEKNIKFVYIMGCGMKCAKIDPIRFSQIFFNLLSNAAKYTKEGGEVHFTAERLSGNDTVEWVRFIVSDNGIGMKPEFVGRAFLPFEQEYDANVSLQEQGTGLGLPIAKELVEKMGGTITLESELGKGSVFTVDLPLKVAETPDNKEHSDKTDISIIKDKTVLLVDDNMVNTLVATRLLEDEKMKVIHAQNGLEALNTFKKIGDKSIDVILMDVLMPEMNGLEATMKIRNCAAKTAKTVPIIAMTANAFEGDVENCLAAGMNEHLSKPIEPRKLFETIAKFLKNK